MILCYVNVDKLTKFKLEENRKKIHRFTMVFDRGQFDMGSVSHELMLHTMNNLSAIIDICVRKEDGEIVHIFTVSNDESPLSDQD